MAIIQKITPYIGETKTSLNGVTDNECTYEIAEGMLILRSNSPVIHISPEMGRELVRIIEKEFLNEE